MLIVILPFNILAIVLSNVSVNATIEQARLSVKSILESYVVYLENNIQVSETFMYNMCYIEKKGKNLLKNPGGKNYELEKSDFYNSIKSGIALIDGVDGYFVYISSTEEILVWHRTNLNYDRLDGRNFVEQKIQAGMDTGWNLGEMDGKQVLYFSVNYNLNHSMYGGWINLEEKADEIINAIQYEDIRIVFDEKRIEEESDEFIIVSVPVNKGFFLNAIINRSEVIGNIENIYLIMQKGAFIALFLIPMLYMFINYLLLSPIKVVNRAHKKLRDGDLEYRITDKANSIEFEYFFDSFNQMAKQIRFLKIENYEKELGYQKMELNNLQLRIRPHFLLNAFNLIYTLSEWHEDEKVQNIILYLSDYFRYIFRREHQLELFGKEQHLLEGYMSMVSVCYPDSVAIEYKYDSKINLVRVPPLLIHNFVENIVKHVVKQDILTHIIVVGEYKEKVVNFKIIDDGPGMTHEKILELKECMNQKESDGSHVGFYNSMRRLKYFYGEEADISISSEIGEGTCVTVHFPYDLEETENGTFDCE